VFGKHEEYEAALRGDPVPRFRGLLVQNGTLGAADADALVTRVASEMQEAVTFALSSPFPTVESALELNYA
jgi:pyruvate dehydrogenase E1 component alpha subunit